MIECPTDCGGLLLYAETSTLWMLTEFEIVDGVLQPDQDGWVPSKDEPDSTGDKYLVCDSCGTTWVYSESLLEGRMTK